MHYKPGCRSNSKFGIIVSVTTTLFAALANRYHNKLFFCAEFPLFSQNTFIFLVECAILQTEFKENS